ncbi:4-(cytidine 5'-diphospho)-2-C-methyl-D-erythritol kinase [Blochmannia endosymbiont of Camponotus (Colobopsis) obliquus]|uniref:4-(cytidine 5'-diphospho)-2-C-methyl-D-erythritol kinase n=1 Tax=Blochmannia endosymbiont of Camponotus (Colobopsis) obliquus TaxID=1505597 RepID=UPI00061A6C2F|nr:4-(cytidine 5'-diphospho)-2-C-methyl-D-erythritol kinase [Blochmannia endosymbiont of Camponotus (Colobopsis) obliquus]AKC60510.1 4-diphosphocytidyl-2-C-methyl-D-erythritol kinase [Blochmannia endosymbiont of Camponotus (Colobopsis) obliquus]
MIIHWPSPAKLNLFLHIIRRRSDGYHVLQTLFHFLNYGDTIKIIPTSDGKICLFNSIIQIQNKHNLIIRAAKLLQFYCWPKGNAPGANIYLYKILPIGSGLGGGSSNAATVLVALNQQWRTKLSLKILAKLGLMLGTDIPAFIYGKTSIVEGIGNILTPINYPKKWYLILMIPINISTKLIFSIFKLKHNKTKHSIIQLLNQPFYNEFEPLVKKMFPIIEQHLIWLSQYTLSRLTGTGSCIFAEFQDKSSAIKVQKLLPMQTRSIISEGTNISPLHQRLSQYNK